MPINLSGNWIGKKSVLGRSTNDIVGLGAIERRNGTGRASTIGAALPSGTSKTTHAAIRRTRLRIDFAAIGGIVVAVGEIGIACETARTARARRCSIGRCRTGIATHTAMSHRRLRIRFATIRWIVIAVAEVRITSEAARIAGAICRSIGS